MKKAFLLGVIAGIALTGSVWGGTSLFGSDDDDPSPQVSATPSESPSESPSPTPSPSPSPTKDSQFEGLTAKTRLRLDGIGAIVVGMTLEQAKLAADVEMDEGDAIGSGNSCFYARVKGGPKDLAFMVLEGEIARVDVFNKSRIRTLSGIGIGSTEADVYSTYEGRITEEPHPYTGPQGHYLVYEPETQKEFSLIFETDGEVVTSFRSGFAQPVGFIEGCA